MDLYREEILDHWQNPQNYGVLDKPDVVVEQVNPLCGDEVTFYFKITPFSSSSPSIGVEGKLQRGSRRSSRGLSPEGFSIPLIPLRASRSRMTKESSRYAPSEAGQARTIIADVRFTGSGCAISMASASMLSEAIKGRKVSELERITGQDVLGLIGGSVAPARLKCAFLALEAIRKITTGN